MTLINGKPYRFCDCAPLSGECPRGITRELKTTELTRCLVPAPEFLGALVTMEGEVPITTGSNPWKDAVIDALIVNFIYHGGHEHDARQSLADLIEWEIETALDPMVSSGAEALMERGRQEVRYLHERHRESVQSLIEAHQKHAAYLRDFAIAKQRQVDELKRRLAPLEAVYRCPDGSEHMWAPRVDGGAYGHSFGPRCVNCGQWQVAGTAHGT